MSEEQDLSVLLYYLPIAIGFVLLFGLILFSSLSSPPEEKVEVVDGIEIVPEVIEAMH